jgi:pilus assembly protein CpaE
VNVLLASRSKETLDQLESCLRSLPELRIERQHVVNGHVDPLHGIARLPSVLVLHVSHTWQAELEALANRAPPERPALIVLGPSGDMQVMRAAMQAGARDYLAQPLDRAELLAALTRIARDRLDSARAGAATMTAFMNAKGGSGATLLACNVAHVMAGDSDGRVLLVDFDLQFGTLPLYLDLFPKRGLMQALANLEELDDVALEGYLVGHRSGLKVLGHVADDALLVDELPAARVERLFDLLGGRFDHVFVDLPRRIDAATAVIIERSAQVVIAVQQSVTTLRDAVRLVRILRRDLAVSTDRLTVVVNRYDRNALVTVEDIERTLDVSDLVLVPNDFRTVTECINSGTPLADAARNAPITKAVRSLETRLGGNSAAGPAAGLLSRTIGGLFKSRST